MAQIVPSSFNKMSLSQPIKRMNPLPLDATEIFSTLAEAKTYAQSDPTAYVGQLVRVVDSSTGSVDLYVITGTSAATSLLALATANSLKNLASQLEKTGFQGDAIKLMGDAKAPIGAEYVVTAPFIESLKQEGYTDLANKLEVGDYLVVKEEITSQDAFKHTSNFIILERNLTNALTTVTGGEAEDLQYVSAVTQDGSTLKVAKAKLPTPQLSVHTLTPEEVDAFIKGQAVVLPGTPSGTIMILHNGLALEPSDFTLDGSKLTAAASVTSSSVIIPSDNVAVYYIATM